MNKMYNSPNKDTAQDEQDENKRQYGRLPKPFRVEAKELKFPISKDISLESSCYDISEGGLCVESDSPFTIGAKMQVKIHIPGLNKFSPGFFKVYENDAEQYLLAITEIAWCRPSGERYLIGMKFENVDEDHCKALSSLITKALKALEK